MKTRIQITFILCSLIIAGSCNGQSSETDSAYMIEEILKIEDPTQAIMELDSKLNEVSEYGEKANKLSEAERVVLFVENLEREVNNGGFHQFFSNSSGDYANETLDALELIGANKTAEIVSRAYAEWPNHTIPGDRLKRQDLLDQIEEQAEEMWNNCDRQFYENEEDICLLLLTYVKANRNEFHHS